MRMRISAEDAKAKPSQPKGKKSCDWHAINQNTKLEFATTWRDWLTPGRLSDYQVDNGVSTRTGICQPPF
jgi:hypothetical protein